MLSIIITTFNPMPDLEQCLESVFDFTTGEYEIIVVDNNSSDGSRSYLEELEEDLRQSKQTNLKLILNEENNGISYAMNQGLKESKGDTLVFLSPHVIVNRDWNRRLLSHLKEGVGAVGPLFNIEGIPQYYASHLQQANIADMEGRESILQFAEEIYRQNKGRSAETRYLSSFCLLIPRMVMEKVGYFDEDLFLGSEDLEYSFRMRFMDYKLCIAQDVFVFFNRKIDFQDIEGRPLLVTESMDILYWKLEEHYREQPVPSSQELWGIDWFKPSPIAQRCNSIVSVATRLYHRGEIRRALEWIAKLNEFDSLAAQKWMKEVAGSEALNKEGIIDLSEFLKKDESLKREVEMAKMWLDKGDEDKALAHLTTGLEIDVNCAEIYYLMAKVAIKRGLYQDAVNFLDKALELKPDYGVAWFECGKLLEEDGQLELAEKMYLKALEVNPQFTNVKEVLTRLKTTQ